MKLPFTVPISAAMTLLTLSACGQNEGRISVHAERPSPLGLSQQFFAGEAAPGEFLTLQSLPPIPGSFEEAEQ
ncbi:hypothetical protein [Pseudomonas sp. Q2-TVG4-2]|uniref:hypothetical protein n=1 Tax=Pseudomonas sp. Q2-TVG4-2 TaxID=1685699 RepID=UPI00215A0B5E|nr:hypothetical protein [Pseudomonas sp. Q2-TVG4-2]